MIFNLAQGYFRLFFIIMAVVGNFYFSIFLRLTWEFLGIQSERECSVNSKNCMSLYSYLKIKLFF